MRRLPVLLLLAGCAAPSPQEELTLFDSAEERARRDVLLFYHSEADDGTVISVTVPRQGPGESRGVLGAKLRPFLVAWPSRLPSRWSTEDIPVEDVHRRTMNQVFAGLPGGVSERILAAGPAPKPTGDLSPDVEGESTGRARVRILHVSATGEIKTLTLLKGRPDVLPSGGTPADGPVKSLDSMLLRLAVHGLR
jgi:hypothetical protein